MEGGDDDIELDEDGSRGDILDPEVDEDREPEDDEDEYEDDEDPDGREPWDRDDEDDRSMFADPGGDSALRAASASNPRDRDCPTCLEPNRLTSQDVALGYQCNSCAKQAESGI